MFPHQMVIHTPAHKFMMLLFKKRTVQSNYINCCSRNNFWFYAHTSMQWNIWKTWKRSDKNFALLLLNSVYMYLMTNNTHISFVLCSYAVLGCSAVFCVPTDNHQLLLHWLGHQINIPIFPMVSGPANYYKRCRHLNKPLEFCEIFASFEYYSTSYPWVMPGG